MKMNYLLSVNELFPNSGIIGSERDLGPQKLNLELAQDFVLLVYLIFIPNRFASNDRKSVFVLDTETLGDQVSGITLKCGRVYSADRW